MLWHVIAQIGDDNYYPALEPKDLQFVATLDKPDGNHAVANDLLWAVYKSGLRPTQTAIDLLHLATIVYTADLRIWRAYDGEDAWSRDISIYVPVTDVALWTTARPILTELLCFLTGDSWTVNFRQKAPSPERMVGKVPDPLPDAVCLFSGGLDSFVGAIDLLAEGHKLALVGHYGHSRREQVAAYGALKPTYAVRTLPLWFFVVPSRVSKEQIPESTMRARSILFLALGTSVASAMPAGTPLYIPENGFISLNVPLTFSRVGSHSTRTTHPHTVALYQRLLDALGINIILRTPYRFATKGEMLRNCKDQKTLKEGIHTTMSCSRPQAGRFHRRPVGVHCGYCVPCVIRRASLHAVGLDEEQTIIDVLSPEIKPNQAAGYDKRAFLMAISRLKAMTPLQVTGEIMSAGPLDVPELNGLTDVFKRGMAEVETFLRQKR